MQLVHSRHSTPTVTTLDDYRAAIVKEIDGVALRVGRLLRDARELDPVNFAAWVERDLPFGSETARRLMAISQAYEKLPPETLRGLPRPWQAMYALKALPMPMIEEAVAAGEIHPNMTVRQAIDFRSRSRYPKAAYPGDVLAGKLMQYSPSEVSAGTRIVLRRWLERAEAATDGSGDGFD